MKLTNYNNPALLVISVYQQGEATNPQVSRIKAVDQSIQPQKESIAILVKLKVDENISSVGEFVGTDYWLLLEQALQDVATVVHPPKEVIIYTNDTLRYAVFEKAPFRLPHRNYQNWRTAQTPIAARIRAQWNIVTHLSDYRQWAWRLLDGSKMKATQELLNDDANTQ